MCMHMGDTQTHPLFLDKDYASSVLELKVWNKTSNDFIYPEDSFIIDHIT